MPVGAWHTTCHFTGSIGRANGPNPHEATMAKKKAKSNKKARKSSSSSGRKYGPAASKKVEKVMHEMKRGTLRSGGSGKKVTSRKQAIAIGLSEARERGAKVPPPKKKRGKRAKAGSRS